MNPIDRNKIWKMVGILALITVVAGGLSHLKTDKKNMSCRL